MTQTTEHKWKMAQAAERDGWLHKWTGLNDDRSDEHASFFLDYRDVPNSLGDVIEIGCGPFTQVRRILRGRTCKSLTLNDPLAREYMAHKPNCSYRTGTLCDVPVVISDKPAEDLDYDRAFDTVILNNVLEHVRDANGSPRTSGRCCVPAAF